MEKFKKAISQKTFQRLLALGIIFWTPIIIFVKLAEDVLGKEPILLDKPISKFITSFSSQSLSSLMQIITHGGDSLFVLAVTVIISALFLFKKRMNNVYSVAFTVGGAGLINFILKLIFQRQRPSLALALVHETSYSFPSGHAMGSSALGFAIILILWRTKWRCLALILASIYILLIGISRIYLGAHYPTDVIAGWCVSAVWAVIVYIAVEQPVFVKNYLNKIKHKKP